MDIPLGAPLSNLAHSVAIVALIWVTGGPLAIQALDTYLKAPTRHAVVERAPMLTPAQMPMWKHSWYSSKQRKRLDDYIKENIK